MSNPAKAPTVAFVMGGEVAPDAHPEVLRSEEWEATKKTAKTLPEAQRLLLELDMGLAKSIVLPEEHTTDARYANSKKAVLALAKKGTLAARVRSGAARQVVNAIWRELPESDRPAVAAAMQDTVFVDGGAEYSLGRLAHYYPKKGETPARPVTWAEARRSLINSGVDLRRYPMEALLPFPIVPKYSDQDRVVSVNLNASNGFPVLSKGKDEDAMKMVMELAVSVRKELREAVLKDPNGAWNWLRRAEEERPWLVALQGKAKGDYYKSQKVADKYLRFYNAYGRHMLFNMQIATQPLESLKRSIFSDERSRTAIGISLAHGGAAELVAALDRQLEEDDFAYVHCGDDSWVVIRVDGVLYLFALDCSSFDLTQHGRTTLEIHRAIRDELSKIDKVAADLWYAYMRERLVVVALSLVRKFKHAGPSGSPLQSLSNDVLMDVGILRTKDIIRGALRGGAGMSQALVEEAVVTACRDLGLVVKLEQYQRIEAPTLKEALAQTEFLFIGYNFYTTWGSVACYCDLPRQMAQLPYPGLKWLRKGQEVAVMEAMRLGAIVMNFGVPPTRLKDAFDAARREAISLLDACISKYGNIESPDLLWAVSESPFGVHTEANLAGVRRAVLRDPMDFWLHEMPAPQPTRLIGGHIKVDWAEDIGEEEQTERERLGLPRIPDARLLPQAIALRAAKASTHPVTAANDGRPPPTAVWLPDKAKRTRAHEPGGKTWGRVTAAFPNEWSDTYLAWEEQYDQDDRSVYSAGSVEQITQEEAEDYYNRWKI